MKYNDNGTIKDIVIKAGDTLPVGTIVEYDGETIPSGWEEVEDTRDDYSTEEQIVGKWLNGKSIYRRTVYTTIKKDYIECKKVVSSLKWFVGEFTRVHKKIEVV